MRYHFSIIDYLQEWNMSKKMERLGKGILHRNIYNQLSAVPPNQYQARFQKFMSESVIKLPLDTDFSDEHKAEFMRCLLGEIEESEE